MILHGTSLAFASLSLLSWNGVHDQAAPSLRPSGVPVAAVAEPVPPSFVPSLRVELSKVHGDAVSDEHEMWKPVCTQSTSITLDQLRLYQLRHAALMRGPVTVIDNTPVQRAAALNIVFNIAGSVPPAAATALGTVEAYIESQFSDPVTITIPVSFQPMGSGVLGATGSNYRGILYSNARPIIIADMDPTDTLQSFLPATTTFPVRHSTAATVTNETRVYFTFGNWKALGGTINGSPDGNMTFNSQFSWDYDPSNGIAGGTYSFVDVIIHEVGHAMGFVSATDFRESDVESLDMYRFQRTDGTADYNPDDTAEFQARPRLVDFNAPNDAHNSDLVTAEYRMSDGSPYQASHFREQPANIGIMDPAFGGGQTFYPNYYSTADANMFDAIGFNR